MFGTPNEVKEEVKELVDVFFPGGGYIFDAIHNIQANVPVDNILAMIEAIQELRS